MPRQLQIDPDSEEAARLRASGAGDRCPFCRDGVLEAIDGTALMGIKRPPAIELYPCIITRCRGCGHLALFDSAFVHHLATARELNEAAGRWSDDGGQQDWRTVVGGPP